MGQSDDVEDSVFLKHQDLCQKLNMDANAANEAWKSYENIRQHYTLEGDQLHWIGCALYVACRKATTPTVGKSGSIQGNCVSLTRLLRLCNLPLIEFFKKSKMWLDMCNMPQDFRAKMEVLERNFSVSSVIFQKYQPIFKDIFKNPNLDELSKQQKSRRHKPVPCTPTRLFEFCWSLFICIKSGISTISDDLVNSYHLLIVCCDLMYSNVLLAGKGLKDLLNPDFPGLPENFHEENYTPPDNANCIVNLLCERYNAIAVEAMSIKEYSLKLYMNKLFQDKVLRGEQSNLSGLLNPLNFDANNKSINKTYEQHILSVGDLDERIFLAEWRRIRLENELQVEDGEVTYSIFSKGPDSNIGSSPFKMMNLNNLQEQFQSKKDQLGMMQLAPPTPLTGRKYLKSKDVINAAPTSNPTQGVIRLQTLLVGCQALPSDKLQEIFHNCSSDTQAFVEAKVQEFGKLFYDAYSPKSSDQPENPNLDFGLKRKQSAQTLFYKVLELVLSDEMAKKAQFDVSTLLKNETFLQCLFACSCEIVIFSYQNKDKTFPWILKTLNLEPYFFYKVIEVIVKVSVDQLTRDMVKHLNRIEEMILESLAWKSSSPLWEVLQNSEGGVPSYEDVALPGAFNVIDPNTPGQHALRKIALDRGTNQDITQSPVSSASERFQSPITQSGVAKKRLFSDGKPSSQSILKSGNQSLLSRVVSSEQTNATRNGNVVCSTPNENHNQSKSKRTGSLALFFRKFYHLTVTRMQTLSNSLDITDEDLKRKIWTIFEYSIMEKSFLMKDRHLDQILMSAVYIICKLGKIEKNTFTEIMRCYRLQPQAESHIYRSVLIQKLQTDSDETMENGDSLSEPNSMPPPTPSDMAATSRIYGSEERGDLIKFYNTVYLPEVKDFVKRLGVTEGSIANLTLSPLPRYTRSIATASPVRKVTGCVMTRVLDPKEIVASPAPQLQYCFNRSPAKDLESINKMVTGVDARKFIGKRLLADETEVPTSDREPIAKKVMTATTFVARKIENIMGDRLMQNQ